MQTNMWKNEIAEDEDDTSKLTEEESRTLISWLKSNRQPISQVKEYKAKTAPQRLLAVKEMEDLGKSLKSILGYWIHLAW